jgi:glycosyltransferase involved in cell wall biosynthesis
MTDLAIFLMDVRGGGAERVMLNLARGFSEQGLAVDLVLVKAEGSYIDQLPPSVRVIKLQSSRLIASIPDLVRYLQRSRPKVLMSALEDTNFVALWAKKLANVPTYLIVTVHNHLSREAKFATPIKRRLTPTLVRLFYPWADHVVAVSYGVADDLVNLGLVGHRVSVIYNPIVTSDLSEKAQEPLLHPWFCPGQPPVILGIGRLTQQKNFSLLIRAIAQVRQDFPVRLVILGEGEEQSQLQALVQHLGLTESVQLAGFVSNPYSYLANAAMLVLSSRWEGFGNVLVEAIAVGTPVISTDCESGPAEILNDGEYGRLVASETVEEMANAILATLQTRPDSSILKQRAQDFTLEKALYHYATLFPTDTPQPEWVASPQQA